MRHVSFAVALTLLLAGSAVAQQSGQISGVVADSSGAVVPGVTVTAIEVTTGFRSATVTGEGGRYRFPSLRPTRYDLTAEISGFRTFRHEGIELQANQSLTVNATIQVGALENAVTVSAETVQVDTTTSALSQVIDHARIVELPLNGRDVARLTTLVAGTVLGSVSTETGKSIPGGLRLSSNGSQERQVAFRLDGTSNTDFYFQENQTFPFPDALQEFSIQTSNYTRGSGQQCRRGRERRHAVGHERVSRRRVRIPSRPRVQRPELLCARARSSEAQSVRRLPRRPGRSTAAPSSSPAGRGRRIKNRAADVAAFVPTIDQRNGNFATCGTPCNRTIRDPLTGENFPNNQIPVSRFDPATVALLKFLPAVGGDGRVQIARNSAQDMNQFVTKIDHQFSVNDQVSGRYFIDHFDNAAIYNDENLLTYRGGSNQSRVRTQNAVVSWKRTMTPTAAERIPLRLQPDPLAASAAGRHAGHAGARGASPALSHAAVDRRDQGAGLLQYRGQPRGQLRSKRLRVEQPDQLDTRQAQHPVRRRAAVLQGRHRERVPSRGPLHLQRRRDRECDGGFLPGPVEQLRSGHRRVQEQPRALFVAVLPGRLQSAVTAHAEPGRALRADTAVARGARPYSAVHDR